MKWIAREISKDKWGVFLMPQFCKTAAEVCYGVSTGSQAQRNAEYSAARHNENYENDNVKNLDSEDQDERN